MVRALDFGFEGPGIGPWFGAGIAQWLCVGLAVMLDAASWVQSWDIFFLVERIFPLELTWVLTPFPQNSFR